MKTFISVFLLVSTPSLFAAPPSPPAGVDITIYDVGKALEIKNETQQMMMGHMLRGLVKAGSVLCPGAEDCSVVFDARDVINSSTGQGTSTGTLSLLQPSSPPLITGLAPDLVTASYQFTAKININVTPISYSGTIKGNGKPLKFEGSAYIPLSASVLPPGVCPTAFCYLIGGVPTPINGNEQSLEYTTTRVDLTIVP